MREVRLSAYAGTALAGIALAGAALLTSGSTAIAADLPAPPPVYEPAPPPVAIGGGWYLRGDVGVTNQKLRKITQTELDRLPHQWIDKGKFKPATTIGLGVGYQFNSWLRTDITGEFRTMSAFRARDSYDDQTTGRIEYNTFRAKKEEWLALANIYLDLGTWGGFTPYIGAGIGAANVRISNFTDYNTNGVVAAAPAGTRTNFAWALHGGFAYQMSDNLLLDMGYRYVNLGKGQTGGPPRRVTPSNEEPFTTSPWVFNNLHSHDIRVGLRWMLDAPQAAPAYWDEPVIRKH